MAVVSVISLVIRVVSLKSNGFQYAFCVLVPEFSMCKYSTPAIFNPDKSVKAGVPPAANAALMLLCSVLA